MAPGPDSIQSLPPDAVLYRIVPTFARFAPIRRYYDKTSVVDFNTAAHRQSCNYYGKEPLQLHYLTHRQNQSRYPKFTARENSTCGASYESIANLGCGRP
jgi:hypothetical protein